MAWQYADDEHDWNDQSFLEGLSAFTFACFFRPDDWTTSGSFVLGMHHELNANPITRNSGNDYIYFQLWTSGDNPSANYGTGAMTEDQWYHIAARWASTEGIETFRDGSSQGTGSAATGTTSSSSLDWNFGRHENGTAPLYCSLAEVAFWDHKLEDDEIAAMSDGASPLHFPSGLVFYAPMHRTVTDRVGGLTAGVGGTTPTYVDHPRVYYPTSVQPMAAAGVSAAITGTAVAGGVTESEIVAGGETIIITLTGGTWVSN